ncbi:hypothetical protein LTR17_002905 [Elasticomyces elasticus]|nr:hypothetical protein LTR17_002905 [Elasticomyces elasticus]
MDSPPPRFTETSMPQGPRFTEHLHNSPPYQPEQNWRIDPSPRYGPEDAARGQMGPRLSNKERSLSPDPISPGLESVWAGEGDKEVAVAAPYAQPLPYERPVERPQARRVLGIPEKTFYILLALLIALAIGLGVGLGVGLGTKKHSPSTPPSAPPPSTAPAPPSTSTGDTQYLIGGAISPAYLSTTGAFNGSGIALASQSFSSSLESGTQGTLVMYFQHHSGEIRWQQLNAQGAWLGGGVSEVVAADAKNSTPLSAVAYTMNGTSTWHIFYIDVSNQIRQRTNSNTTNVWVDGPVNLANLTANDADMVGMQACWYGSDYGDSDYLHTPLPNGGDAEYSDQVGMHLWYASDDTTFQQLGWRAGDDVWELQQSWLGLNGHAGVGCYSWGPGTVTYVMLVDLNNTVNFYWKDTNTNITNSTRHPINEWTNTSIAINNVNPATSLGYTNFFYAQMADDNMVNGYNISWAAENTSIVVADSFTVQGEPGISGTHLSVSALPNSSGGSDLVVFMQTNGSDVSVFTRDLVAGQWTGSSLPIPQT